MDSVVRTHIYVAVREDSNADKRPVRVHAMHEWVHPRVWWAYLCNVITLNKVLAVCSDITTSKHSAISNHASYMRPVT
jgi:hypothetical protein